MSKVEDSDINIIVVDDETIVLSLVRDALEEDGYQIDTALSSADALEIIDAKKIDLIISDIRMPKMSGTELVRKAREKRPDVEVVFMTGYANLSSAKDAIKQGASDYILKPFELSEIRQAVSKAVEKIRKEAIGKQRSNQLDRLSDLSQMLFTAGDRISLITVSLKFALMHCSSSCGAVLYWNSDKTRFSVVSIADDQTEERQLPEPLMVQSLDKTDLRQFQEPLVVPRFDDHPLFEGNPELAKLVGAHWANTGDPVVVVPLSRQYSIYGLLMICATEKSLTTNESSLKFLSITASQLAMSLENLELLDETQKSYARLKELQDETIQLEKMASRGEMSAEIGHELNNFLGVVAGNISLLEFQLKKQNYGELEKYVRVTTDTIEKMKQFTANLMDLRPISSKKETIYFDKLINEVIDYLRPQKRFQGIDIRLAPIEESFPFEADVVHIQQLLYNIFNNAADATLERHKKEITVKVEADPSRETFRVAISDTGVGISPELLQKAFHERFTTKEHGHGFGLLVSRRIIDGHGGGLNIESAPGQGTTIQIDFPLSPQYERAPALT